MQLRPLFLLAVFSVLIVSCNNLKKVNHSNDIMLGTIEEKTIINKGGKEVSSIKDLYFNLQDGDTYFIKFINSNISFEEASALVGQKLSVEAEIIDGLWDVPDNNPQQAQSRTGKYIVIRSYTPIVKKGE